MENEKVDYLTVEGPEGLKETLEKLHAAAEQDRQFAAKDHFVLYQLGAQRSLIKVDLSKKPYQFWYNDLLGRPATKTVKDVLADFLWDKCGTQQDEGQ